jgi:alcohol dehydrogenase class IV
MWFFDSPLIVHGEDALSYLERLEGRRAMLVTDPTLVRLGHAQRVRAVLEKAGFAVGQYDAIEPEPGIDDVRRGAAALQEFGPDWIVALGGGSVIDAAKAMWILYERPETDPESINPVEPLGLRAKAHFAAIPTTSGTGSEATWAVVLSDRAAHRKLGLGSREDLPDLAILDPGLAAAQPPRLTADTGLDALTHAIEGFTCTWHNDFSDGLCLKAAQLVFEYLPRAYRDGSDIEARTRMQNAAAIAGMGFGNAMAALAHALGHALGAVFAIPHGRAVSLALPYTIEYALRGEPDSTRYSEMARFLRLPCATEVEAGHALAQSVRTLETELDSPRSLRECGISQAAFIENLDLLIENAYNDAQTVTSTRIPDRKDVRRLLEALFEGETIDF